MALAYTDMKIIVETLNEQRNDHDDIIYKVDHSKDEVIATKKTNTTIDTAKARALILKSSLLSTQKVRVLIYRNDEPDETRTGCEVIEV